MDKRTPLSFTSTLTDAQVSDFDTVEDFWSTYNHIKRPGTLEFGGNYHVFKV